MKKGDSPSIGRGCKKSSQVGTLDPKASLVHV